MSDIKILMWDFVILMWSEKESKCYCLVVFHQISVWQISAVVTAISQNESTCQPYFTMSAGSKWCVYWPIISRLMTTAVCASPAATQWSWAPGSCSSHNCLCYSPGLLVHAVCIVGLENELSDWLFSCTGPTQGWQAGPLGQVLQHCLVLWSTVD